MPIGSFIPNFFSGFRLPRGEDLQAIADQLLSAQVIVAAVGGGKTNATAVNGANVNVSAVATAADSILLPPAKAGMQINIRNTAANAMQVFGQGTDTINGAATGTGVSQAATTGACYFCAVDGAWFRLQGASG